MFGFVPDGHIKEMLFRESTTGSSYCRRVSESEPFAFDELGPGRRSVGNKALFPPVQNDRLEKAREPDLTILDMRYILGEERECICGARFELIYKILDPRDGRIVRMFKCDCGKRIFDEPRPPHLVFDKVHQLGPA